jgi:hypothetical protein
MIAVEGGDDLHVRNDRLDQASVDGRISEPQRLHQALDLEMDISLGHVEAAGGDRAIDFAPDGAAP